MCFFNKKTWNSDGFQATCRACQKEYKKEWNLKNPNKHLGNKIKKFWPNVSAAQAAIKYNNLFLKQEGCCAICTVHQSELNRTLAVDHCHKTGQVRGLLCYACNSGIGFLRESQEILDKAKLYLKPSLSLVIEGEDSASVS